MNVTHMFGRACVQHGVNARRLIDWSFVAAVNNSISPCQHILSSNQSIIVATGDQRRCYIIPSHKSTKLKRHPKIYPENVIDFYQDTRTHCTLPAGTTTCYGFLKKTETHSLKHGMKHSPAGVLNKNARDFSLRPVDLVEAAPKGIQPYLKLMRLDKPIGTWLLFWPGAWSIALAAEPGHLPDISMLALFAAGALVMRGAGCTINDMWDKDFDKAVERTKSRPIASGDITPYQAFMFLGGQLSVAFTILMSLNLYSIILGASSMLFVISYPLMKRFTYWPQAVLGLTFNWGALLGWAAVKGYCDWSIVLPLYAAGISWTLVYDTIYGHQDKNDDLLIGLKSTSILMGLDTKKWLTGFSCTMVGCLGLTGLITEQTLPYYIAVAVTAAHLGVQVGTLDINNPEDCWKKFRSNQRIGAILFAGIIAGTLAKVRVDEKKKDSKDIALSSP